MILRGEIREGSPALPKREVKKERSLKDLEEGGLG
jgi:hypothetical protein